MTAAKFKPLVFPVLCFALTNEAKNIFSCSFKSRLARSKQHPCDATQLAQRILQPSYQAWKSASVGVLMRALSGV
jgi:hypothetical protein